MTTLNRKPRVLFQLSGSIACYKACFAISELVQSNIEVQTVASKAALKFVGEATLEGLSGRPVFSDIYERGQQMDHISLARWADVLVLAPASANTINRIAAGLSDDAIGALFLANGFLKPYLIAPAMNSEMLNHPATQSSLHRLRSWGVQILAGEDGTLACGEVGAGRLIEPPRLVEALLRILKTPGASAALNVAANFEDQSLPPERNSL